MPEVDSISDDCPVWAATLINRIKDLEIKLGNLLIPGETWAQSDLTLLMERMGGQETNTQEAEVEDCFFKVSRDLLRQGYSPEKIADYINNRVRGQSRLPYCSADEVAEAGACLT